MKFNHSQATQLLSSSEMDLYKASQDPVLAGLSPAELKSNVHAARSARDKFQDLLRRQRLDSRDRTGSKDGLEGVDNARTEQKLEALTEILQRFEAQVSDIESGSPSSAPADDAPVMSVGDLMAGVRSAVELKQESAAANATAGSAHAEGAPAQGSRTAEPARAHAWRVMRPICRKPVVRPFKDTSAHRSGAIRRNATLATPKADQTTTGSGSRRKPKRSYTLVWIALASVMTSPPVTGFSVPPRLTSTSACLS